MTMLRTASRTLALAALLILCVVGVNAQDDGAGALEGSPALVTTEGTPASLCEAAGTPEPAAENQFTAAEDVLEDGIDYRAIFCTDAGPIYVDLYEDQSPLTVNNLVFLAANGFYDGTIFHRVLENFMAQGGDPEGTGRGGPGYQFADEFDPRLSFDRPGLLAMANANRPEQGIFGTNGSQFFITTVPTPYLNYRHTIFGEVIEGYENIGGILLRNPDNPDDVDATTLNTVLIVTDPSLVETTYEALPAPTQEDIAEALSSESVQMALVSLFQGFPLEDVTVTTTSLTPEEAVAAAPNSVKAPLESFLTDNDVEFIVSSTITVNDCVLELAQAVSFGAIGYTVYALPSAEAATAALDDTNLAILGVSNGQTTVGGLVFEQPVFTGATTACGAGASAGRVFFTRGRYLIEAELVMEEASQAPHSLLLERFAAIVFDHVLSTAYRVDLQEDAQ